MLAEQLLREGRLQDALTELKQAVQSDPADAKYRIFLFQLLAVSGKWPSAVTQLEVVGDLDAGALSMVQAYREAIRCEQLRQRVFAGNSSPLIFGEPERWVALLVQAVHLLAQQKVEEAQRFREEAFELAPATAGRVTSTGTQPAEFQWIADADSRLGPVLEAHLDGKYYWVPFHRIAEIELEAPADLRDFVWMPAQFTWANGGQSVGLIPTRYPGSETRDDEQLQLARKTDWQLVGGEEDSGTYVGLGQRMLSTDQEDYALLDIRRINLHTTGNPVGSGQETESANPESAKPSGDGAGRPGMDG